MKRIVHGALFVHLLIAAVFIGGIALGISAFKNHVGVSTISGTYCSPDGTLSDTQSIQSHRSYCIKSNRGSLHAAPNTPVSYAFSIVDDQGNTLKDFKLAHEKILHLIVVRADLQQFQHLHPAFDAATGVFTVADLTFPTSGDYRIFADFVPTTAMMGPGGQPLGVTLSEDVKIAGSYTPQNIGSPAKTATADGYTIDLTADPGASTVGMNMFSFRISKDGKAITNLEPYLGALGHAVVLKEGTLDYIHAHALQEAAAAQSGTIDFHVDFPAGGSYKVFLQFQHEGAVVTTSFVVPVSGAPGAPEMDHTMH